MSYPNLLLLCQDGKPIWAGEMFRGAGRAPSTTTVVLAYTVLTYCTIQTISFMKDSSGLINTILRLSEFALLEDLF